MFKFLKQNNNEPADLIGVGDIVVDTFIELIDAWIETDNPQKNRELCMRFGDKIPYKKEVSVYGSGNSINASLAARKLGLKAAVITNLGDDDLARQCLEHLSQNGINADGVSFHKNKKTNHNFILRHKEDRTILVHHNEYEYAFPKNLPAPKWIYLSSLANNSLPYHKQIADFLKNNPKTKLAFQPGTFQIKLGAENLADLYKLSEIFFCNKEEAEKILRVKHEDIQNNLAEKEYHAEMKKLLKNLAQLGPKITVITDGPKGAFVYDTYSGEIWHGQMYPDIAPPVDRTGAGDAFASAFTSAIILGHDIKTALLWAPVNSMSVVQHIGAQAGHLNQKQIQDFLGKAPADYQPILIN